MRLDCLKELQEMSAYQKRDVQTSTAQLLVLEALCCAIEAMALRATSKNHSVDDMPERALRSFAIRISIVSSRAEVSR